MKYNFSILQILNWLFLCKQQTKKLRLKLDEKNVDKQEIIKLLHAQRKNLLLIKDVFNRKTKLSGINPDFLRSFKQIKKDYGVED